VIDQDALADDDRPPSGTAASEPRRRLHTQNELLIAALASGATHRDAGRTAGVSERTVRRRLEDVAFCERVAEAEGAYVEQVSRRLTGVAPRAVDTMVDLMTAHDTSSVVKLRAAGYLLTASRVWRETHELETRIRDLEAQHRQRSQELTRDR
jgi:hypothetical protein